MLPKLLFLASAWALTIQFNQDPVQLLEARYRSAHTLQATFLESYAEGGRIVRSESGTAYFGKPGKMRWEYRSPENNLYVIDGKWSWFYAPADHTVTRVRARPSSDWRTPLALLAGGMKVSKICGRVSRDLTPPSTPTGVVFRCDVRGASSARGGDSSPLADSGANSVVFEVNRLSGELSRILVTDPGGVQVEFRFSGWQFNPRLDPGIFRFEPPQGVAIVDGDLAGAAASPLVGTKPGAGRP
jgi:outer membrane lipoprotein carrier protein